MRILLAVLLLVFGSQANAGQAEDDAVGAAWGCMYRTGLSVVGYQFDPQSVREAVKKACAKELNRAVLLSLHPAAETKSAQDTKTDKPISLDTTITPEEERAAAEEQSRRSHMTDFFLDTFMKDYIAALRKVKGY